METRKLGKLEVSEIGAGCMSISTDGRRLRPAIRPQRRNHHDSVRVQQRQDLPSNFIFHESFDDRE